MTEDLAPTEWRSHSAHWGVFSASWQHGRLEVRPHPGDPDPNAVARTSPPRCAIRRASPNRWCGAAGWNVARARRAARPRRVRAVPWDRALDLLAAELARVRDAHGADAIFGGSYGWASAGRFHHAQSQLHRFLNTVLGGYVRSVNSYSAGASSVILPHILGRQTRSAGAASPGSRSPRTPTSWSRLAAWR